METFKTTLESSTGVSVGILFNNTAFNYKFIDEPGLLLHEVTFIYPTAPIVREGGYFSNSSEVLRQIGIMASNCIYRLFSATKDDDVFEITPDIVYVFHQLLIKLYNKINWEPYMNQLKIRGIISTLNEAIDLYNTVHDEQYIHPNTFIPSVLVNHIDLDQVASEAARLKEEED